MRFEDKKFAVFLIFACILFVISVDLCGADKNKKNKPPTKHDDKNASHHHHKKNSTDHHHHNHTDTHHGTGNHSSHVGHEPDIGWSLHNNPGQPVHQANPNGLTLQHHHPGHGDTPHPAHPQQHPQPSAPSQDSGPSALGAGLGGLALGAVGGAAGGYLLSNALNKNEEKEAEAETSPISETTLSALINETSSDSTTSGAGETTVEAVVIAQQNLPVEAPKIVSESPQAAAEVSQIVSDTLNATQTTEASVTTQENSKDKNASVAIIISIYMIVASVLTSFVIRI